MAERAWLMRVWRNSRLPSLMLALLLAGCSTLPYSGARFHPGYYEVHPGETLYSIAWRFDLNYRELARWNGISAPYTIYPGQRLRMNPPPGARYAVSSRQVESVPVREPKIQVSTGSSGGAAAQKHPTHASRPSSSKVPQHSVSHWVWPAKGTLTKRFSSGSGGSRGIDIGGKLGEPVRAAAAGQVVYSGSGLPSYGKLLIIQHNERYLTAYAHNEKLLVHEGEMVRQGQEIATMGRSGTNIHRPMLHFEIRRDGEPVDPLRYLPRR
ncbi:peptidoglycan DD-metalloendopeptidase family protein [Acidihalobacter prosperus]